MIEEVARVVLATSPEPVPTALAPATRLDLADEVVRKLQARFGQHVIYRLSRARPKIGAAVLSSGSLGLDRATGIGGVPRGKLALLRGGESSGKTTLAYHLLAEAQRDAGLAALIDGEGAADPATMRACGVDLDDLILASPRDAAEALEMVEILVRCRALDAVVATALPPTRPGLLALALRRLNTWTAGTPTAVVLGDGAPQPVGAGLQPALHVWAGCKPAPTSSDSPSPSPTTRADPRVPGRTRGSAPTNLHPQHPTPNSPLVFFASLIVDLQMLRPLFGPGGDLLGLRVRAVVAKNRLAAPGGLADFDILRGQGLDRAAETLELALADGLVERRPQGFVWEGVFLGRGRAAARAELESDPALRVALAARLDEPRDAG